ncbi:MAG: hypothetical protein WBO10_09300 [Pyrinomonadaceae bacterium]
MKLCSTCGQRFDDQDNFCRVDGAILTLDTHEQPPILAPPPTGSLPDEFEITLGAGLPLPPPRANSQMPGSTGSLRSFGGLERLGPVGKLKRFFFGDS